MGCDQDVRTVREFNCLFQSTQPEWAATKAPQQGNRRRKNISIHAARMGCDYLLIVLPPYQSRFQSTQPEWAATPVSALGFFVFLFQSTQPEWAATNGINRGAAVHNRFQSTQPEWAATQRGMPSGVTNIISIHAARMGCDKITVRRVCRTRNFNPRSPNGLRPDIGVRVRQIFRFQSTQPEWAATASTKDRLVELEISIHAARMGCDR